MPMEIDDKELVRLTSESEEICSRRAEQQCENYTQEIIRRVDSYNSWGSNRSNQATKKAPPHCQRPWCLDSYDAASAF